MNPESDSRIDALVGHLGYTFRDPELLLQALTHRSYRNEQGGRVEDNERLELLGDAVLSMAILSLLWTHYPQAHEGELTRRRADLVREPSLANVARAIQLGEALRLGKGEERTGGRQKSRLLASAFEACLGAVYLDGGLEPAVHVCERLFLTALLQNQPGADDYKSQIQEYLQAQRSLTPYYKLLEEDDVGGKRRVHVAILAGDAELSRAWGSSKLEAEQAAAHAALDELREPPVL